MRRTQTFLETLSQSKVNRLDRELLLSHCLGCQRADLYGKKFETINETELSKFRQLMARRFLGEPIAYLLGQQEFWSRSFVVNSSVLIPRADTELLVEIILAQYPQNLPCTLLELGTGSGAIAISLGLERPNWQIIASDCSSQALEVAKLNAKRLNCQNVRFCLGSWYEPIKAPLPNQFDLIVSNPPYIAKNDPHLESLKYEPYSALSSDNAGLADLQIIIERAEQYLLNQGQLFLEHGFEQKDLVLDLLRQAGLSYLGNYKDLSGRDRVCSGRKA